MIRILLIPSSDYLGHPFPQRHNHLFERIHDGKEFEVHVVRFNIFGETRQRSKCIIHEIPLELKTKSTPLYYLSNAATHATEIVKIVKSESIDVVVAGNLLPPLLYRITQELAKLKTRLVFDLQDYYPVSAAGYMGKLGTVAKGLFEAMTQYLIKRADVVTTPGTALAIYAKKVGAKRVEIVPNGVSQHFFQKHDGKQIRQKLGIGDEVVVGYIGSVEFWLDMKPLIKAVSQTKAKLLIIGKHLQTGYAQKVEEWIRQYHADTTWLDFVPHEEVPKYIAAIDIGTIPFDTTNLTAYYAAPNKLWEYLSQEIVVAATPIPEIIKYKKYIAVVKNETDYANVIQNLQHYKEEIQARREEIRQILQTRTWDKSAEKMKTIITSL